ncbi:MAG: hypothetical protein KIS85_01620 [Anaerolineales bacterium]|nr:hypothetical protein [Anaerolineales bacterium]
MRIFKNLTLYHAAIALLLAAFLLYGWAFIQRTVIVVDGQPMHALFDDAMISMQFAKNFARGDGLVWNAGGERVEGFSNPLWVLVMAVVHLFPTPLTETSFYIKLISLACLLVNLLMVKGLAEHFSTNRLVALAAVFLTAFYFPLNNWSLQGMEVGLQALLVSAGLLLALRALQAGRFQPWTYVLFGLGVLLRMDTAAPVVAAAAMLAWIDPQHRRQHLAGGLAAVGGVLLALTLWRLAYYGDALPNTYYLKLGTGSTILRVSIGLRRLWDFVWASNWAIFALPLLLPALDKRRALWPLYAAVLAQVGYSVYVGGDAWEHVGGANRFIAVVMPLFFVLYSHALGELTALVVAAVKDKSGRAALVAQGAMLLWVGLSLVNLNTLFVQNAFRMWTLQNKPVFVSGTERYAGMGLTIKEVTTPQATVALVTAGNIPYFAERPSIDLLGKVDPVIARLPARLNASLFEPGNYQPGHNKWDYAYSIGVLRPDVVAQVMDASQEEAMPYLVDYEMHLIEGIPYYFRSDSPHVRWELLSPES